MTTEQRYLYYRGVVAKLKAIDISQLSVRTQIAVRRQLNVRIEQLLLAQQRLNQGGVVYGK